MKKIALLFIFSFYTLYMYAQTDSTKSPLKISGFVDAYFQLNTNKLVPQTSFTEQSKTFALGMASIKLEKTLKKVGFCADLGWGKRVENANGDIGTSLTNIKQLYMTYSPTSKLKLTAGNFSTFIGYEYVDAPLNLNYSTVYGFTKGPFFHNGLKADYAINENWAVMAGVFNETDRKIDLDGAKNVGLQVAYSKGKFKGYLNYLSGKVAGDSTNLTNHQVDLTCSYQATDKLGVGLNVANKIYSRPNTKQTNWITSTLYMNYKVTDKMILAARGEYFIDKNGEALGVLDQTLMDFTLSLNYKIEDLTLILEGRTDNSNKNFFFTDTKGYKSTQSLIFAAVYAF